MSAAERPVVYFDGTCGFCDRTVSFLLARDARHVLRFAPLQGATAAAALAPELRQRLDTLVLAWGSQRYLRSAAVVRALAALGGRYRLAAVLLLIPRPWRDALYNLVARNRYRWFGRLDACRLPTAAERGYFLD